MSTEQHTPSPWDDVGIGDIYWLDPNGGSEPIATVYLGPNVERGKANTRLIKAAPDLLAVAKLAASDPCDTDDECGYCLPCMARAAVSKATDGEAISTVAGGPNTVAALQAARLFISGEALPTKDEVLALIDAALPGRRTVAQLQKGRVTAIRECNAYLGHATGLLLAGGIECIVITADRESAQAFIEQFNTKNGHSRFSTPVAMVQRKDVEVAPK